MFGAPIFASAVQPSVQHGVRLWPGRWVKFEDKKGRFPRAFHARDGRVVGIFCAGDHDSSDAYIQVVDPDGDDLHLDVNGTIIEAKVHVNQIHLEGVTDRRDIPPKRIKHLPSDWQPRQ